MIGKQDLSIFKVPGLKGSSYSLLPCLLSQLTYGLAWVSLTLENDLFVAVVLSQGQL